MNKARVVVTAYGEDEIVVHLRCSKSAGRQIAALLGPTSGGIQEWAYELYHHLVATVGTSYEGLVEWNKSKGAYLVR